MKTLKQERVGDSVKVVKLYGEDNIVRRTLEYWHIFSWLYLAS